MTKIIKELIIMLLVCLAGMLLFAVVFYEYIPNRKIVPEVAKYEAPEQVKEMLADPVDQQESNKVVTTYSVTASDLTNYKATKDYVPGKSNPFASVAQDPETGSTTKKSGNDTNTGTKSTEKTPGSSTSETTQSTEPDDTGIK